jgi:hypothetical protein
LIDLDAEIDNWVRLVRTGRVAHHCGSVESKYRPPLGEIMLLEEPPRTVRTVFALRGWRVEAAWRSITPHQARMLLSWVYVRNRALAEAARRAKVPPHKAAELLAEGRHRLAQALDSAGS